VLLLAGGCARGQCVEQVRVERSTAVRHYRAVNGRETKSRRRVSAVRDPCRAASRAVRGASALGAARWTGASATAMQWQVRRRRWGKQQQQRSESRGTGMQRVYSKGRMFACTQWDLGKSRSRRDGRPS
jgi:hypothetical protein